MDAYATSKQCNILTALAFARENPRLHINAIEPGFSPGTSLGRDAPFVVRVLAKILTPVLVPFVKIMTTPKRAARVLTGILTDTSGRTGIYFDETGRPMPGSAQVRDPKFQDRVVAETRAFLSAIPA